MVTVELKTGERFYNAAATFDWNLPLDHEGKIVWWSYGDMRDD